MGHCVRVAVLGAALVMCGAALGAERDQAAAGRREEIRVPQPASVVVLALCILPTVRRRREVERSTRV